MNDEDILYRLKQIKEYAEFVDEGHIDVVIQSDDLDWLVEQVEENKKLKDFIRRNDERYREQILPKFKDIYQENKELKNRLSLVDALIEKSKKLTDLYEEQLERYKKALEYSQISVLHSKDLSDEEINKFKKTWMKLSGTKE